MAIQHDARVAAPTGLDGTGHFFLVRLDRLAHLDPRPNRDFDAVRLLRLAIYSTYVDCCQLGLESEARAILFDRRDDALRGEG
jgi:hypothetical protein